MALRTPLGGTLHITTPTAHFWTDKRGGSWAFALSRFVYRDPFGRVHPPLRQAVLVNADRD
jgi:hypothetical protein